MSNYAGRNRRRNVLSQPKSQLRIIFIFALLAVVYALLNAYISIHALNALAADTLTLTLPKGTNHDLQVIVQDNRDTLNWQLGIFSFLSFFMLCLAGVLISHRIGGPIYHLKHYMEGVMGAKTTPRRLVFRKGDFFHDLAETFNQFQEHEGLLQTKDDAEPKAGPDAPRSATPAKGSHA